MSFSDLLQMEDMDKPIDSFDDHLGKAIRIYLNGRPGSFRDTNTFRASSIYFMCSREQIFQHFVPKKSSLQAKNRLTADMGTDFHTRMQNTILGPMGILKGTWRHKFRDEIIEDSYHPEPNQCGQWEYIEKDLYCQEYNLSGHIDGLISIDRLKYFVENKKSFELNPEKFLQTIQTIPEGEVGILDMKSVAQRNYINARTNPVPEYYKWQANLYMYMMKMPYVYFLYTERENFSMFGKIYKYEEKIAEEALRKIDRIATAIKNVDLIDSYRVCTSISDKRAKECPHRDACFFPNLDFKDYVAKSKAKAENKAAVSLNILSQLLNR